MSRDLEHLLKATAAAPSRPLDPAEITRLARKRRRRRHVATAIGGVAATAGLATAVAVPLSSGSDGDAPPPAAEPDSAGVPPRTSDRPTPEPYAPGFDCPVTQPPTPGFQPPDGYPPEPNLDDAVWFGTEALWTVLPVDGYYGQRKSVWWSTSFPGGPQEPQPDIDVTWERLDLRDSSKQSFTTNAGRGTNAHTPEDGWFMIAGTDPADPGCWQVTAKYKGAELSYVYEIPSQANEGEPKAESGPDPAPTPGTGDVEQSDLAIADAFVSFATEPSPETAASLPFADRVELGLGPDLLVERTAEELSSPDAWLIDEDVFRAYTGPFSALERIRRHVAGDMPEGLQVRSETKVVIGDYPYCAGSAAPPPPDGVKDLRRVSIQPADGSVTSWLGMFYVDLYVDEDRLIHAVTLDLCEP